MRKLIVTALTALAILGSSAIVAQAAPAARRAWSCNVSSTCFYPFTDGSGSPYQFFNPDSGDQWLVIPSADRYAMYLDSDSAVEVWNAQTGFHACYAAGSKVDLNNEFGHAYINYGHANSCSGVPNFS
jgi:hypothetical protein